jgi:hypothetical protein
VIVILILFTLQLMCLDGQPVSGREQVRRVPLERPKLSLRTPKLYARREIGIDPKTGDILYYDPKPQVKVINRESGQYELRWIGYDGKEKVVRYQPSNVIDVIVSATTSRESNKIRYTYTLQNLPSSALPLTGFIVQHFSNVVEPIRIRDGDIGYMSKLIEMFREGNWLSFGRSYIGDQITPGKNLTLELMSSDFPGLVECRVLGGKRSFTGAGEEMPTELENELPGYDQYPRGYTIGPKSGLRNASKQERLNYFRSLLPKFRELGWVTKKTSQWYEKKSGESDVNEMTKQTIKDLKSNQITSEVHAIIQSLDW